MNISALAREIQDHQIIGLCEATHGQLKLNLFRNRLVKQLITTHNFTVIVLEEQYSCAKIIDKYIKNSNNISYLDGLDAFPFLSKTFVDLLKWLKLYKNKNKNKISIIGIDCQDYCPKYKSNSKVTKYVNNLMVKYNIYAGESTDPYGKHNFRDKSMYKIFMRQYNNRNKYLIFGHIGHLQKEPYIKDDKIKWFGNYLYNRFTTDYFVIGNTFYNGEYLAKDIDNNYDVGIAKVDKKKELDDGIYYINQHNRKIVIYEGDVCFSSKNPNKTFNQTKINNRFDMLVVINNELPFTLI